MIFLENELLYAAIAPKGAELQNLVHKKYGREHMWRGDAAYWGKHSPVLFPIVGGLKNDTYYYKNKTYQLPRHGFARDKVFAAEQLSATEAVFTLTQDEQTLAVYPFTFILKLRYRLNEGTLSCTYEVYNPGNEAMLFSIGAHPAFAVPFTSDTSYTDYYLEFNKAENLQRWKLEDGLIASPEPLALERNVLPLQESLFYKDAIVLKQMKSNQIKLGCNKISPGLHFKFDNFPFFGIWAAKDAPFVCLEPWCGIADSISHDQQLVNKEGINVLPANSHWQRTWSVECF